MAGRIQRRVARPQRAEPGGDGPFGGGRQDERDGPWRRSARRGPRGPRVSSQAITDFTVQFATLSSAGIPIVRALSILAGKARPGPLRRVLDELVEDVATGTPLSAAMGKHPGAFDALYAAMVHAGETGGVLERVLERLAEVRGRIAELKKSLAGAMVYPLVVLVVAVAVVAAVVVLVIPKFELIFQSFDVALPGPTRVLLGTSAFLARWWPVVFGLPLALFLLHLVALRRGGAYRRAVHHLALRLPVLGGVLSQALVAGFARTFGTLLQAGVPHLEALGIVRDTSANDVLAEGLEGVRRAVQEGEGLAAPMEASGVFDELVCNMVDVGEQTGELDGMLLRVAEAYERQVDHRIELLLKLLQPALLIVVAAFVGFIVVALFLPLMRIMSTLNQA